MVAMETKDLFDISCNYDIFFVIPIYQYIKQQNIVMCEISNTRKSHFEELSILCPVVAMETKVTF